MSNKRRSEAPTISVQVFDKSEPKEVEEEPKYFNQNVRIPLEIHADNKMTSFVEGAEKCQGGLMQRQETLDQAEGQSTTTPGLREESARNSVLNLLRTNIDYSRLDLTDSILLLPVSQNVAESKKNDEERKVE